MFFATYNPKYKSYPVARINPKLHVLLSGETWLQKGTPKVNITPPPPLMTVSQQLLLFHIDLSPSSPEQTQKHPVRATVLHHNYKLQ